MGRKIKKLNFWVRRRSFLPVLAIGSVVVLVLFFNEETSIRLGMEYDHQISALKKEIKENLDSAAYYRSRREALEHDKGDLEYLAREQYHMQKPDEEVFILIEGNNGRKQ